MTVVAIHEYTADNLRSDFLSLDVRSIALDEMWVLLADHVSKDDYIVAVDTLRRENKGKGFDVTVIDDGRRHLARVATAR